MKNKFIALALVTLSIATTTVSCTKDDVNPTDVKAQVETTNVEFAVSANNKVANSTGRMVDKNVVPAYVDQVEIWAKNTVVGINAHEVFTFGAPGVGVLPNFSLSGVALGTNTFQATSLGKDSDKRLSLDNVILPSSGSNVLDVMKAHTPYIIATQQGTPTAVIAKTGNAPVAITMGTYYGRVLAKFVQETPDANKYYATVSAKVPNGTYDGPDGDTYTILPEKPFASNLGFEWSNANSRLTQSVVFTIKVYASNGGALLNTITKEVEVASETTKLVTYTLKNTEVETNIEAGGIVLTFPTINDVEVPLN